MFKTLNAADNAVAGRQHGVQVTRTPKRRALGGALRQAREESGYTLRAFALHIGREPGVLSRWETGERTPKPEQVAQLLTSLGITGERYEETIALAYDTNAPQWVAASLPEQRSQLSAFVDFEQNAANITEVSPLLVPGLLQTSNYIRAIMHGGGIPTSEIATRVAIRIGRRDAITRDDPVKFFALVGEGVLYQTIGDSDVMIQQLKHMLHMATKPNIDLRIIPYDSGWNPALEGAFTLIDPHKGASVVQLENRRSGIFLHEDDDVSAYRRAVDTIIKKSSVPDVTVNIINRAIQYRGAKQNEQK